MFASLHGNSSRSRKIRGCIDPAHHLSTLVICEESHCRTVQSIWITVGRAGAHNSSRGWTWSDRARTRTGHKGACGHCVTMCRFLSSLVAGPPADGILMGTGPDSAAMGTALTHGDGSLSKRAGSLNVPPAPTSGKLSLQGLNNRTKCFFTHITHFKRNLDGLPILSLEGQVGCSVMFKTLVLHVLLLSGEDSPTHFIHHGHKNLQNCFRLEERETRIAAFLTLCHSSQRR